MHKRVLFFFFFSDFFFFFANTATQAELQEMLNEALKTQNFDRAIDLRDELTQVCFVSLFRVVRFQSCLIRVSSY